MASTTSPLPGIIVINARYLPQNTDAPALVGASSFTNSAIRVLHEAHILAGLVLYARDETLSAPRIVAHRSPSSSNVEKPLTCLSVSFNFRMSARTLSAALLSAFSQVSPHAQAIVYYQTDTLLSYHPSRVPFAVTHHGPFVSDFARHFSASEAAMAFGDNEKAGLLRHQQALGLRALGNKGTQGYALLHSGLQRRVLLEAGVPAAKLGAVQLAPPISVPGEGGEGELPEEIEQFLTVNRGRLLLFTAVARLDHFKNVPLLISAALLLLARGIDLRVLVAGDPREDPSRRHALLASVPAQYREHFLVVPRLPKPALYALFARSREAGMFVCPSRYETLGITPLEAALSGVATLMPDSPLVEASALFPAQYRVAAGGDADATAVAERIVGMVTEGSMRMHGSAARRYVEKRAGEARFGETLLKAWAAMSDDVRQRVADGDESDESPLTSDNSDSD